MSNQSNYSRAIIGGILVVIGGIFLLRNFYIIDLPYYLFRWYTLVLGIGAALTISRDKREAGIIMMAIGGFALITDVFDIYWSWRDIWRLWPVALIFAGLSLIFRKQLGGRSRGEKKNTDIDMIDETAVFGGNDRVITSTNFKGGKLTSVFGGNNINLEKADLAPGHQVLDIFTLFGGNDLYVPADWTIQMEVTSIFGAFSDKRKSVINVIPNPEKVLIIKGFVMFGGGEVKNF